MWFRKPPPVDPEEAQRRFQATKIQAAQQDFLVQAERDRKRQEREDALENARLSEALAEQHERRAKSRAERRKKEETAEQAAARKASRKKWRKRGVRLALTTALVGVNAAAVVGQVLALVLGAGWPWWVALPIAMVVEAVAVVVGYFVHHKIVRGYSAFWQAGLSYLIGGLVGAFNYAHTSVIAETAAFAPVFGAASLLSPLLWQLYSQWLSWKKLLKQRRLKRRLPSFGLMRWLIPSLTGETWAAFKLAVAEGIESSELAIKLVRAYRTSQAGRDAVFEAQQAMIELALAQRAALAEELYGEDPKATEARASIYRMMQRIAPHIPLPAAARTLDGSPELERDTEVPAIEGVTASDSDGDERLNRAERERADRHAAVQEELDRAGAPTPDLGAKHSTAGHSAGSADPASDPTLNGTRPDPTPDPPATRPDPGDG
ncbi:hypothetical protein AB0J28_34225 [Streptosporangium canum]|uniref:hypothetical protein n=1 Tax=Streptosporangium canum TaxID=324952 RepID=UPI00343FA277